MQNQDFESWVTVFEASNIDEANIVKGMLEASDIPVFLEREAVGAIYRLSVGPLSEVAVKVPKNNAARASQLLQSTHFGVMPEE
ncbi:MAG: DUF2007 domain-containing protein [Dethiobacter sp.]|jgi:hypothetical protein|nr:DUF2007 domain-containing protein [Dethiobacter sp.]